MLWKYSSEIPWWLKTKQHWVVDRDRRDRECYWSTKVLHLGYAGRAEPVSVWYAGDLGFMAVRVAAAITSITQQQQLLVVSLTADLTVLSDKHIWITSPARVQHTDLKHICGSVDSQHSPLSWWTSPRRWTCAAAADTERADWHCAPRRELYATVSVLEPALPQPCRRQITDYSTAHNRIYDQI